LSPGSLRAALAPIERYVCAAGEDEETRARKTQFVAFAMLVAPAAAIWAVMYYAFGEPRTALIPLTYVILTAIDIALFLRIRRFEFFRQTQQAMILLLPFALQTALGGFVGSSAVIVWSFLAVISAVVYGKAQESVWWFAGFVLLILTSAVIQPGLRVQNALPLMLVQSLFALNVTTVSGIAFAVLYSFLTDRRKLRVLEVAYLRQEMMLRQQEKLATLGTLAAGVAHELNNPAAATRRAAEQLEDAVRRYERACRALTEAGLADTRTLLEAEEHFHDRARQRPALNPIDRADREEAIENWLDANGVADAAGLTGVLLEAGLDVAALEALAAAIPRQALGPACEWLACAWSMHSLSADIRLGSARVSDIVASLKAYSFLDHAPEQTVNVGETIEATLSILGRKIGANVTVHRALDPSLPEIDAFGADLNQVWTNLLTNAAEAIDGSGEIKVRTRLDGAGWVAVEIEDSGRGIPETDLPRIFDPFFTTKPPGQGTGMGLATAYTIVQQKHQGTLAVESRPGRTVFTVRLPVRRT
jgi:signal transduction histidine kinase